jgi:hypothetical protein
LFRKHKKAKSRTQHFDRAAKWLTYIALAVGIITLIVGFRGMEQTTQLKEW